MCALFGWLDYKGIIPHKILKRLTQALANAAEERGTDAAGYIGSDSIVVRVNVITVRRFAGDIGGGCISLCCTRCEYIHRQHRYCHHNTKHKAEYDKDTPVGNRKHICKIEKVEME